MSSGKETSGLNLGQVERSFVYDGFVEGSVLAAIDFHNNCPRGENGRPLYTMRQLLGTLNISELKRNPLLLEYIVAFGAHGRAVIENYLRGLREKAVSEEAFVQRHNAVYESAMKTLRETYK